MAVLTAAEDESNDPSSSSKDTTDRTSQAQIVNSFKSPGPRIESNLEAGRCSLQDSASEREIVEEESQGLFAAFTRLVPGRLRRNKATERTPLLSNMTMDQSGSIGTGSSASGDPLLVATASEDSGAINSKWKKLSHQVKSGEFLLYRSSFYSDDDENGRNRETVSTHDKRQAAQDEIRSLMEFSVWQCLLAIFAYIGIAVLAFSFVFNNWSIIDSAYFAVVTFSTIGFGDLVPDTYEGRIFTCFFALSGVAFLGIALGVLGANIIEAEEQAVEQAGEISKHNLVTLFTSEDTPGGSSSRSGEDLLESPDVPQRQPGRQVVPTKKDDKPLMHILREFAFVVLVLVVFASAISNDPGINANWDIGTGLYFAIICATTVGYGDFAPQTQMGRLFAIFFIPLAVGAMGHWLSVVASSIITHRQSSFHQRLQMKELSQSDLDIMDGDGDGQVSRAEFLEFMLVAMNKVEKEFIDEMRGHFERLDTDKTGFLSREDLIASAKRKLQSPHRKLQMSQYKQQLLQQAADAQKPRRGSIFI